MTVPGTSIIGVPGGLDPLKIVVPTFTVLSIEQSTPLAAVYNTLTVSTLATPTVAVAAVIEAEHPARHLATVYNTLTMTLTTDVDLAVDSLVNISGITGSAT
ncbi:hypothetical protein T484DRAFT_1918157, partial [Baffinella frigidus]